MNWYLKVPNFFHFSDSISGLKGALFIRPPSKAPKASWGPLGYGLMWTGWRMLSHSFLKKGHKKDAKKDVNISKRLWTKTCQVGA